MMTLLFVTRYGARAGFTAGALAGLLFGLGAGAFVQLQSKRLAVRGDFLAGERIVYQGAANHWRGVEARGGWLILTERALVFRAHGLNAQNAPVRIELSSVRSLSPTATLGIVPNGLRVDGVEGARDRFVVGARAEWIRRIESRLPPTGIDTART